MNTTEQEKKVSRANREQLAQQILESTGNIYLRDFLECYIVNPDDKDVQDLTPILDYILNDGYDIAGFGLFEIPTDGVYCFDKKDGGAFDIYVLDDGGITAGYLINGETAFTSNIETAVQSFCEFN